jgi:cytosine/adenosine deaminase-related metal-dependent hydrolase
VTGKPVPDADLLIRDAELLVTMTGDEIVGGWVAISGGVVDAVGAAGGEPRAAETLSARGCLVTPGLVNAHHHMFQNLTRCFAPVLNSELMSWAGTQSDMWVRLDEEAAYVSAWVGLAELALGGCTLTTDDLYAHPRPKLIDAELAAARDIGFRFDPCRGAVALGREDGLIFPPELVQDTDTIMADTERLIGAYHDRSPHAMTRIVAGPSGSSVAVPGLMEAAAELAERHDVRMTTHLSQFAGEEEWSLGYFGMRQVEWLESVGWASSRAWVAHCIFVTARRSPASPAGASASRTARPPAASSRTGSRPSARCAAPGSTSAFRATAAARSTARCGWKRTRRCCSAATGSGRPR